MAAHEKPAGEPFLGFDHVDLFVRDLPSTRRFFTDRLGLPIVGEGDDHAFLRLGDQVLGLRRAEGATPPTVPHHLALRVRDLDVLVREISARGGTVTRRQERPTYRSIYLEGPEGLTIELIDRPHPEVLACEHGPAAHRRGR
jgi:catechol 2,3-dioxygenase-like lactoylglutathione lyase family enzyme